jgi:hypothetical protein
MNTPTPPSSAQWMAFVLAAIGALSWLPIIYSAVQKRKEKPHLAIFLDDILRIVENEYNVVLNLRVGILTKIKDTFIDDMTIVIEHSNGEKREFKWAQTMDLVSQTSINDTVMPTNRILNAIAYNLPKNSFTEPYVSFINPLFRQVHEELHSQLRVKSFYVIQQAGAKKQLELSDAFIGMCNNYRTHYTWTAGDYKAALTVHTADNQSYSKSFAFHIDQPNSETFRELNIEMVIDKLKTSFTREEDEKKSYDDKLLEGGLPIKIKS